LQVVDRELGHFPILLILLQEGLEGIIVKERCLDQIFEALNRHFNESFIIIYQIRLFFGYMARFIFENVFPSYKIPLKKENCLLYKAKLFLKN
jgi:hypothetical protein